METTQPGDKTAVCFTWVFDNDVINKNTAFSEKIILHENI